jgi:excisionase family DNA binding protein
MKLKFLSPEAEAALLKLIDDRISERVAETFRDKPEQQPRSPWLTIPEAAEYLRTTPAAVRKRIARGQLRASRPEGSRILLRREEIDGAGPQDSEVLQ